MGYNVTGGHVTDVTGGHVFPVECFRGSVLSLGRFAFVPMSSDKDHYMAVWRSPLWAFPSRNAVGSLLSVHQFSHQ